jgi:hypothetical protein
VIRVQGLFLISSLLSYLLVFFLLGLLCFDPIDSISLKQIQLRVVQVEFHFGLITPNTFLMGFHLLIAGFESLKLAW